MSRKGWVLFAVMCLVWGIPYLFIKVAVEQVSVPVVVFARTGIGALILLPLAIRSARRGGGELDVLRRHWRPLVAFAALTGFADQAHLTRWFRRVVGVTPGVYRNSVQDRTARYR